MNLMGGIRTGLNVQRHRGTTAHVSSAYPFQAETGLGHRGVYLGFNMLTGGGGFAYDPFEAYRQGLVTNPNMLIAGEPGMGKSACAKTFLYRSIGVFGRWAAIADPKGEYLPLADALVVEHALALVEGPAEAEPLLRRMAEILIAFSQQGFQHPYLEAGLENYLSLLKDLGLSASEIQAKLQILLPAP
jgi:hypothetical protein